MRREKEKYTVINIRELIESNGDFGVEEKDIIRILSEFSCPINLSVENFLKNSSVEFTKKHQSVTYLVFGMDDVSLMGYFTITIKTIEVSTDLLSGVVKRKISRIGKLDEKSNTYSLPAYMIAQIGKNYSANANILISGKELVDIAISYIKNLQYQVGGLVVFLESENTERLIRFYKQDNKFKCFNVKVKTDKDGEKELVQMLRIL